MSAWISVYCEESVGSLTPQELLEAISVADFWTLAEWYEVPEEQVQPALELLRIEPAREDDFDVYELHYRGPDERPVCIQRWAAPARVQEEIEEALERLKGSDDAAVEDVRDHLRRVCEVIGIELGWTQVGSNMGAVFAGEVARCLAQSGRGYILWLDGGWSTVDKIGAFVHLLEPNQ
jgi:hypothetical protein